MIDYKEKYEELKEDMIGLLGQILGECDLTQTDGLEPIVAKEYNDLVEENEEQKPLTNKEKLHEFVRKDNKKAITDIIEFCEENDIDYAYFENVSDLFDYYDEDDYKSFSNSIIDIICKDGKMIKVLN